MEKLTIHRALSELKLIVAKIEKGIKDIVPSGTQQTNRLVNGVYEKVKFEDNAKSSFQSVTDLIDRKNKIKSAIVKANGVTIITVAGEQMTIADAINLKSVVEVRKKFIDHLRRSHNTAKATVEQHNAKVDANALQLAASALQKQNVKIGDDDVQKVIAPYVEANKAVLIDPLNIEDKVKEMEEKLSAFEAEVDAVLSEANAVTFIEF